MTNISSYTNKQGQYVYQKEVTKHINTSGASGASGQYDNYYASGVSGASTVVVKENIKLSDISPMDIADMFTRGDLTLQELQKWLSTSRYKSSISNVQVGNAGNLYTINFTYQNKQYFISCAKDAAASQIDNERQIVKTMSELNKMGFSENDIAKYFIQVSNVGTAKYALKPDCGYKSINDLLQAVKEIHKKEFQDAQSNLIMQNFLLGNVTYTTAGGREFENTIALRKNYDGTTITSTNYEKYAADISKATGLKGDELKKEALKKFKHDFARGDVAFSQAKTILDAIGVKNYTSQQENGNYVLSFDFEGEHFSITCNVEAAKSGVDNIRVQTFDELKAKFDEEYGEDVKYIFTDKGYKLSKERLSSIIAESMKLLSSLTEDVEDYAMNGRIFNNYIDRAEFFLRSFETNQVIQEYREELTLEDRKTARDVFLNVTGTLDDESSNELQKLIYTKLLDSEDVGTIRLYLSLATNLSSEIQIPDSIVRFLEDLDDKLAKKDGNESAYISEWKETMQGALEIMHYENPGNNINDVFGALDAISYNTKVGYELFEEDIVQLIESFTGEIDGSFSSMQDALDFGIISLEILDVLQDNGYTKEDVYGEGGLLENGTLQILVSMTKLSDDVDASMLEIDDFISSLQPKDRLKPFENMDILNAHVEKYNQNSKNSIFSILTSTVDSIYSDDGILDYTMNSICNSAKRVVAYCDDGSFKNSMMQKINEEIAKQKESNVDLESFKAIVEKAYNEIVPPQEDGNREEIVSQLSEQLLTAITQDISNSNVDDDQFSVTDYYDSNKITYDEIYKKVLRAQEKAENSLEKLNSGSSSGNGSSFWSKAWDFVKTKALDIANIASLGLAAICPPVGIPLYAATNLVKSGLKDEYGIKTHFKLRNVLYNLPDTIIKSASLNILNINVLGITTKLTTATTKTLFNRIVDYKGTKREVEKCWETVQQIAHAIRVSNNELGMYDAEDTIKMITKTLYPEYSDKNLAKIVRRINNGSMSYEKACKRYDSEFDGDFASAYAKYKEAESFFANYENFKRANGGIETEEEFFETMYRQNKMSESEYDAYIDMLYIDEIAQYPSMADVKIVGSYSSENGTSGSVSFYDCNNECPAVVDQEFVDKAQILNELGLGVTKARTGDLNIGGFHGTQVVYDYDLTSKIDSIAKGYGISFEAAAIIVKNIKKNFSESGVKIEESEICEMIARGSVTVAYNKVNINLAKNDNPSPGEYISLVFSNAWEASYGDREAAMLSAMANAEWGDFSAYDAFETKEIAAWRKANALAHGSYDGTQETIDRDMSFLNRS